MPGTILLEDAQKLYTDRLQQHAQDALQAVQQVNEPPLRNTGAPSLPNPQIDPNVIVQNLQQHAQDAWQAIQQANQPPLQGVQIDPNDITQRLQQHAQDAFQAVDQTVQPISQGLQQAVQPAVQAAQTTAQNVGQAAQDANQPPFQNQNQNQNVQPSAPADQVDSSSHAAFVSSLQPYADKWSKITGIPSDYLMAWAASESNWGKAGNALFGIKQSSQPGTATGLTSGTWEQGQGATTDVFANYNSPDQAFQALDQFLQGSRYRDVYNQIRGGQITPDQFMQGINAAGYATDPIWGQKIGQIAQNSIQPLMDKAAGVVQGAKQAATGALGQISQFGDKQLTAAEAYAACGPAAAVRFAQMYGRNPTLREATDLAKGVGWTAEQGMAGLQSESKLFTEMGIPHRVVGADWQALAREAQSGNPVTISTTGHYFTADSYDPRSGAFHVGSSGTDLKGGSEWMTPEQMQAAMGPLQGGLAADNPGTPAPSPISGAVQQAQQLVQQGGRAIQGGLQQVDRAVQGAVSEGTQAVGDVAGPAGGLINDVSSRARQAVQNPDQLRDIANQVPLPLTGGSLTDVGGAIGTARDLASQVQTPPETENVAARAAGTGLSALGTVARAAYDQLDRLSVVSTAAREAAGEDVYGQKYAAAGGPQLEDEYRQLLTQRMGGDDSGNARMVEIADQLQQINDTIRAGKPMTEVNQALSAENPLTPVSTGLANIGAAIIAAPLIAGEAPLVARALAEILQPGTNPLELARAARLVSDSHVSAPQIADAIDQVRKMPGTAELAPVRAQVEQSSTDLLQAMLDAARAKGVDPDRLTALEQQISEMDPTAATRRALTAPSGAGGGMPGAVGDFLTGQGSELGAVSPRFATTLGGAVAGGVAGNATTPEDAMTLPTPLGNIPIERGARIVAGAGAGAALGSAVGYRGGIDQTILESLRNAGLHVGPPRPAQPYRGIIPEIVDQSKQMLLTSPTTHIGNVIGNTIELARQPIAMAMGGRADDAFAGLTSVVKAMPQAAGNAISALRGLEQPNLVQGASRIPLRQPIYRALSAADAFTRTLGEYQGMSAKANQLLRDAGMAPGDPGAASFLATHAADLFQAGTRSGAQSVFGQAGSTATARSGLENVFRVYNNFKEGLLASPDKKSQAMGALLDFEIPFSGVPVRMLQLVASRTPPGTQIRGAVRAAQAIARGDGAEAQRIAGETALESSIQFLIARNIVDGNIRGPDDPDHPNGVHMPGLGWINTSELGAYALPMQVMSAFADGYEKGGQNIPPSASGATDAEKYANYYGPRFNAALNASMKPFVQAVPGANMIRALSVMLQGDVTGAGVSVARDAVNRLTVPGAARFVENLTDPVARDVAKKGVASLWEGPMSAWPGLAERLPAKIDPTTGEVLNKARSGIGTLVGQQQDVISPLSIEADRLKRAGFDVTAPKTYPDTVSIGGADIKLSPDEQRQVTQITGKQLGALAERLNQPDYQNSTDTRKAQLMQAYISAVEKARVAAVRDVVGVDEVRNRLIAGQRTAGRLNVQASPPAFTAPPFLSSSSQSAQEQQAVGAGR